MRKLIDACALFAAATCVGFIGTGVFVYLQRDVIAQRIEGRIRDAIMDAIDLPMLLDRLVTLGLLTDWEWGAAPTSHRSQERSAWFVVIWSEAQRERFTDIPPPARHFLSTLSRTRGGSNTRKRQEE